MAVAAKRLLEAKKSGKLPAGASCRSIPTNPYDIAEYYAGVFIEDAGNARHQGRGGSQARRGPRLMPRPTRKIRGWSR